MGLFVNQNENRTELQQRLDAELRAKAAAQRNASGMSDDPIDINDSAYLKGTKQTTSLDWAWLLIGIAVVVLLAAFVYLTNRG
ncbi:hypothetical protein KC945_01680 [Candidatus Saccharibacteria bacterium]|jgi:hypothetical protein|nr:hypothetical protein [Candidatus Saccharibacteria bacterium]